MKEIKNVVIAVVVVFAFITASNVFQGIFEPVKCFFTTCKNELVLENEKLKEDIRKLSETNRENIAVCEKQTKDLRDNVDGLKRLVESQCALDKDKEAILSELDYITGGEPEPLLLKAPTPVVAKEKTQLRQAKVDVVKTSTFVPKTVKSHAETDIDAVWAMYNRTSIK